MKMQGKEEILEKIIENYYGTILAFDKDGKVVHFNSNVLSNTKELSEEKLRNSTIFELADEGYWNPSPSVQAFNTKEPVTLRLEGKVNLPLITTSVPILDENNELQYVVAYSQDTTFVEEILSQAHMEKVKSQQLLKYASGLITPAHEYIAESKIMKQIMRSTRAVATSDSVLIFYGESGTGKEILAKYAYENSNRNSEIFLPVNCAALPEELIESELFGYEKGAFTGALNAGKPGLFELADKGTLFLDEIGELPLPLQSKLLRVLDCGEIKRIGGGKIRHVDVRIIAATNRNLKQMVKDNLFREDLYYRLNVIPINIPPIRERRDDILPLCYHFLREMIEKYGESKMFSINLIEWFKKYDWPGNVREIRNLIERLYITSSSDTVLNIRQLNYEEEQDGRFNSVYPAGGVIEDSDIAMLYEGKTYKQAVADFEKEYIAYCMRQCDNKVVKAAEMMKISRSDLYYKLKKYELP